MRFPQRVRTRRSAVTRTLSAPCEFGSAAASLTVQRRLRQRTERSTALGGTTSACTAALTPLHAVDVPPALDAVTMQETVAPRAASGGV